MSTSNNRSQQSNLASKGDVPSGIFQRLSIIRSIRSLNDWFKVYADQSVAETALASAKIDVQEVNRTDAGDTPQPLQRPSGSVSDSNVTTRAMPVFVGGFLSKWAPNLNLANPNEIQRGLGQIGTRWRHLTDRESIRAHHLLFSTRQDLQARFRSLGIPVQDVLMATTVGAMNRFNAWAFPETNLGFILSFRTDKAGGDLHGLVFPKDSQGNRVNLSRMVELRQGDRSIRVDYQGYLHRAFEESLADFAAATAPDSKPDQDQISKAAVRRIIMALRDCEEAGNALEAGKFDDLSTAVMSVSRKNAEDNCRPGAIRDAQTTMRREFAAYAPLSCAKKVEAAVVAAELLGKIKASLDIFAEQAATLRKLREQLEAAHRAYADSPYAYHLITGPGGSFAHPNTITTEWARALPQHGQQLLSDNPFLWDQGAKAVTETRMQEAKEYASVSQQIVAAVDATMAPCTAAATLNKYRIARLAELRALLIDAVPMHLAVTVTDAPPPTTVHAPGQGFCEIDLAVLERANARLIKHRPFDPQTDANRNFCPIYHRPEDPVEESPDSPVPISDDHRGRYAPVGIDPTRPIEPEDIELALAKAISTHPYKTLIKDFCDQPSALTSPTTVP